MMEKISIGLSIRQISKEKKISVSDLSKQMDLSRQTVYSTFARNSMAIEEIDRWANALGVTRQDIIDRSEGKESNKSSDNGAFGQEVIDRMLAEMKEQYEARIHELKETIGDLREQLKFNRDMMQVFKEGNLGKTEGATNDRFLLLEGPNHYFFSLLRAK